MTSTGLAAVPRAEAPLQRSDLVADAEVRWCPGCGDYSILTAFQQMLPTLGIRRENMVVVSGIGCSSRFPYYVDTYGLHSIHGRAPAIATGIAVARPDLAVWVVTGDGDALSIGGNHLIHALRRNVNITIVMFNNQVYGLTKGQYSPTSHQGMISKSSPDGAVDYPFDPLALALGAGATFVGRAVDTDRAGLTEVLTRASLHRGASIVEILQNCVIFNDGAYADLKAKGPGNHVVRLVDNEPITFADGQRGFTHDPASGGLQVVDTAEAADRLMIHDPTRPDPTAAFSLTRLTELTGGYVPVGVFRDFDEPTYDDLVRDQITKAASATDPDELLQQVLTGPDTWEITETGVG
jgi:2-oxoglutarate ferredoxin oxidoreductase subunit beta